MKESYEVYGLRRKGDREVRYIGVTRRGYEFRFRMHMSAAKRSDTPLGNWLREFSDEIESFVVAEFDSREEAFWAERGMIATAARLGQRLFNQLHNPQSLDLAA